MVSVPLDQGSIASPSATESAGMLSFREIFAPLASLKLTVALFAMSAFLVLAGTFAQVDLGIWDVMKTYFRSYVVWIDLKIFFPPLWFPEYRFPQLSHMSGGFWFPGGRSIGMALLVNICAAHLLRFKVQGSGTKLILGWIIIALGMLITTLVILYGNYKDGVQDKPWFDWDYLWYAIMAGVVVLFVAGFAGLFLISKERWIEKILISLATLGLVVLFVWIVVTGNKLDDSSLKILWNIVQGSIASLVLLLGCNLVFKHRAGIVLLHTGVALLMVNELWIASVAIEEQITVEENKTTNVARDIRTVELTITNRSHEEIDEVLAVPRSMLKSGARLTYPSLPFAIEVNHFFRNSRVEESKPDKPQISALSNVPSEVTMNRGIGSRVRVIERKMIGGAKSGSESDIAAAIVTIVPLKESAADDEDGEETEPGSPSEDQSPFGTYLLSQQLNEMNETMPDDGSQSEILIVDGKEYELSLHAKRNYKPYSIKLKDVEKEDYVGTETPRSYWSSFEITDNETGEVLPADIRMNEPLRFRGETFYQSGYRPAMAGAGEVSTFQVVTNDGWMIPYLSCCIVGFGMLAQFSTVLFRFLLRRDKELLVARERQPAAGNLEDVGPTSVKPDDKTGEQVGLAAPKTPTRDPSLFVIVPVVLIVGACLIYPSLPKKQAVDEMRFDLIGQIPIASGGRVMPLDTFARVTLEKISERQEVAYVDADYEKNKKLGEKPAAGDLVDWEKHSAMEWMMDVLSRKEGIDDVRIFRIYDPGVLSVLQLQARKGYRYSFNEIRKHVDEFAEAVDKAGKVPEKNRRQYHKAIAELSTRFMAYDQLKTVSLTRQAMLDEIRDRFGEDEVPETESELISRMAAVSARQARAMKQRKLPLFTPRLNDPETSWETLAIAQCREHIARFAREKEVSTAEEVGDLIARDFIGDPDEIVKRQLENIMVEKLARMVRSIEPGTTSEQARRQAIEIYTRRPEQIESTISSMERETVMEIINVIQNQRSEIVEAVKATVAADEIPAEENRAARQFVEILDQYRAGNTAELNEATVGYLAYMNEIQPNEFSEHKVRREFFYSSFSPFYVATVCFIAAFMFAIFGWVVWTRGFNWISFGINSIGMAIVLYGTVERCLISGRPPVTNLYSSAIFIALALAIIGLAIQFLFRIGIGNLLCAVGGTISLLIARNLAVGEDTFEVVVAVLDTQFWLATHVLCVTLGYATTYAAGLLGIRYVLRGVFVPQFKGGKDAEKQLSRMIYGMTCFAILFSFVGTVLGGLWADVSWGRFWGWDPKENGALIIVIWNALILHARWGGIVRDRGIALLAIGGCIVTTWSWFGVNQLGIGLHSYGFTQGVLVLLLISSCTLMGMIFVGLIPQRFWLSRLFDFSEDRP